MYRKKDYGVRPSSFSSLPFIIHHYHRASAVHNPRTTPIPFFSPPKLVIPEGTVRSTRGNPHVRPS